MLIPTPAFLLNLKLDLSAETPHWFSQVHSIPLNAGFIIVKSLLVIISLLQYQRFWKMKRKEKGKYYRVYYVLWQYYRTYFIMLGKRMWFVYTIWFFILWNSHVSHANLAIAISSSQNVILWTELATMKNFTFCEELMAIAECDFVNWVGHHEEFLKVMFWALAPCQFAFSTQLIKPGDKTIFF